MPELNDKKAVIPDQVSEQPVINKEALSKTLKDFINKLGYGIKEFCEKLVGSRESDGELPTLHYHSLSPINDADKDHAYFNALKWALDNRKEADIKNIALTGPYGSGKSSVLKTFQQKNKDRSLHFLNISLATFKEEIEFSEAGDVGKNDTKIDVAKNDTLRLIELSILQQIFYHEKDEKIPDSRFAKIKSLSKAKATLLTILLLITAFSVLNILYPNFLFELLWYQPFNIKRIAELRYFSLFILFGAIAYFCYKSIRFFRSMQISVSLR